ncbi:MAG TPA: DUF494 family protein [Candidatus Sulfotelmatobacter sp.]|nr:DUF494 family protein [Candidatus Sulfotelmatobacter sp.]
MSGARRGDGVLRAVRLLAEQLEAYLEGDELAFEALGERFEEAGLDGDELHGALQLLRSFNAEAVAPDFGGLAQPGRAAHRVLSSEERATLSPEAWGFLLDLRRRGTLDAAQFERVLDHLNGTGIRPVDLELAREVAVRVALRVDEESGLFMPQLDVDRTH